MGFNCDHCDREVDEFDDLELIGGRGWWRGNHGFCSECAEKIHDGRLPREETSVAYKRGAHTDRDTGFIQMERGAKPIGGPRPKPPVVESSEVVTDYFPEPRHDSTRVRKGTCPHEDCDFRGTIVERKGYSTVSMCPVCGGVCRTDPFVDT